ncbi:murein biosynthesis integral membrane protein MurJ [Winogradskyella sp.]|jgi:putative peptidoglycan lipid II flippase|uniref:murein biosynthesis integral membrane protein MurJ n=1 Tax=Winogradskyella sp. TaxID=1883156 RepID=UPI0025FD6473|nr:lipid II flippase MurJ [Winogradskyella sp.]MCT4629159.1 MATE family efflux transporter [Winogradskyella sp.]
MASINIKSLISSLVSKLKSPLVRNVIIVALVTLFIKVLAFYKETIIASKFGLGFDLDTFLVALLIPSFIQSVFLNSLTNLFIPNYIVELKNKGNIAGFQSIVFLMAFAVALFSTLLAYFVIDLFLEEVFPNKSVEYYLQVKKQLFIILPCLALWGFTSVISGLLEISNKFLVSTIQGVFPILTVILCLLYFKSYFGDMVLAYGSLFGSIISFIFILLFGLHHKVIYIGKPVMNKNSWEMVNQLPPKISSSFLSAMNNFIDQFFAGQLAIGSIAALNYGNRFPAFGVTIVIMAFGSVLLPHFSRLVNEDLKMAYSHLFKTLKIIFFSGIIVVVILILFSDSIIELWLERDEFTAEDTIKVSRIQQILLINVPFYLCTRIIVKFLTSINKNKFMAWVSLLNLVVNVILNIILIKYYDVYGLAFSTTLVLIISSFFYFGFTYKQFKKLSL